MPLLNDKHKLLWVACIRNLIKDDGSYCNIMQYFHINEKWFTVITNGKRFYLCPAKEHQYSTIQHKKHITKVMFLSAITHPCIIPSTREMFDSKIGIWAFAKERPAARNSKNCPAGTMEWHQVSANKQKVREMLLETPYRLSIGSGQLDGGGGLFSANRTTSLLTFCPTTQSFLLPARESDWQFVLSTSRRSLRI